MGVPEGMTAGFFARVQERMKADGIEVPGGIPALENLVESLFVGIEWMNTREVLRLHGITPTDAHRTVFGYCTHEANERRLNREMGLTPPPNPPPG